MKTKYIFTFIFFLSIIGINAQAKLNNYKYVLVPKQYDFFNEADKYQLNSLTKFLLEKKGFKVYFDDDEFPKDLAQNRCLSLSTDVQNNSKVLKTKLVVELKDCNNKVVFSSAEGTSRHKEFKKAYHEALRQAFQSFNSIDYKYLPQNDKVTQIVTEEASKKPKKVVVSVPPKQEMKQPKAEQVLSETKPIKKEVTKEPEITVISQEPKTEKKNEIVQSKPSNILYAQVINNGYQVVDSTPKIVMILYNSGEKDVFIVKGKDALVYKKENVWIYAEHNGEQLKFKPLDIRF